LTNLYDSVAAHLIICGIFNIHFIAEFLLNMAAKIF